MRKHKIYNHSDELTYNNILFDKRIGKRYSIIYMRLVNECKLYIIGNSIRLLYPNTVQFCTKSDILLPCKYL